MKSKALTSVVSEVAGLYLKTQTPPLWMSTALKATVGRPMATQSKALSIDLWVTTRCELPSASRISAGQVQGFIKMKQ